MDIRVDVSTKDCVLATWERIMLAVWRGKTTVAAVRRGGDVIRQYAQECPEPLLLLTIVEEQAPLPPLEARMELVACLHQANGFVERSALVFEGEGFRAASVRAVVAGLSLFSRPEYPHRVFASVGAAARFLSSGRISPMAPHRVIRMVNEARRAPGTPFLPWMQAPAAPTEGLRPR